jgi:nucleotide-binding universal stress UspA family protein
MATAHQTSMPMRLQMEKIVVLTDFSPNAETALRFAAGVAREYKTSIVLAHAYLPLPCAFAAPEAAMVFATLSAERRRLRTQLLKEAGAAFLQGIHCTVLLIEGAPKDLLGKVKDADLLVVGTSGATGIAKAALGSTAEAIFRASRVPVLTVGPQCDGEAAEIAPLKTVLYATDFSPGAARALPYALSIARKYGAQLALLHVVAHRDVPFSFERYMASAGPSEALHALAPDRADLNCLPLYVVGFGKPSEVIIETAKNHHASVIVMGARSAEKLSTIVSHFGGGTAHRVAANAECPVLTIPNN